MPGKRRKKPAEYRGEQNKETRGIPRGTEHRNNAGLKTREQNKGKKAAEYRGEQNKEHRHSMPGKRRKEILWKLSYQHNVSRLPAHSEKDTDIISVEHRVKTDPSVSTHSAQNGMCLETDT